MPTDWASEARLLAAELLDEHAGDVDRTGHLPPEHLDELARRGFYGFVLADGMTPDVLIDTIATVIGGCLATGFVWAQHLGALRSMAMSANLELQQRYLQRMRTGEYRCGVSYAGARSIPTLFAESTDDGIVLTGSAPFVTGWDHIHGMVASVRMREQDTESVTTLLIPLDEAKGITAQRIPLIAADASATVRLEFERTVVDPAYVIATKPLTEFAASREGLADWVNGTLPLGVLGRCLQELKNYDVDITAYDAQYSALRARFAPAAGDAVATYSLRADLAHAAVLTAAAVTVAAGSKAVVANATAERLMRQATWSLVSTTRDPIKAALLNRLTPAT